MLYHKIYYDASTSITDNIYLIRYLKACWFLSSVSGLVIKSMNKKKIQSDHNVYGIQLVGKIK